MKKALSMFLVLSLCLALLAVPALAEGTYTPGTYTASATGHEEGVTVTGYRRDGWRSTDCAGPRSSGS